jgi:hypothetical protein
VLPDLQIGLLSYLNGNPYVKQKREGQVAILQQKLLFIESEQQKLDSLKNNYNRMLTGMRMPSGVYNNAMNPAELYEQSFQLASQKEYILNWLNTESKGILLIDGFKHTGKRTGAPAWLIFGAGLVAGSVLGIGMALLFGIRENLLKPVTSNVISNGLPAKEVQHEYFG